MNPPPRPKPQSSRDLSVYANCSKCGHGKLLASGYNASTLSTARKLDILKAIGWTVLPRILCRGCACPMDADEMLEYQKIKHVKYDGINFNLLSFQIAMDKKYGHEAMKRFFTTPEV